MEKINFYFNIQDVSQMVYEEDFDDLNETEQNTVRILFNHIRMTIITAVMNTMEFKGSPVGLVVKVPVNVVTRMLELVIDLIAEIQGNVYIENIYTIVDLSIIQDERLKMNCQMLMAIHNVIQ